ncbi:lytic transglycosylase domain-containing protein [Sphingomonas sp. ASV193]|uniref:lytic transglycosylase domain-containing protein n=1 Tax=Sphingomonas sp. ASV193 TaxID=3144405 RepID=UPI0032E8EAC1
MARVAFWSAWLAAAGSAVAQTGSYGQPSVGGQLQPVAQQPYGYAPGSYASTGYSSAPTASVSAAIGQWRSLRQSGGYSFASYAGFLNANPGWPGERSMRAAAEKAMRPGENAALVLAFFAKTRPQTGNGWARLAEAYAASGRADDAWTATRWAWGKADLPAYDEASIQGRFAQRLTAADYDARVDSLLFAKKPAEAYRLLPWTAPDERAKFQARIALQGGGGDAEAQYALVQAMAPADAGLLVDRARYFRARGADASAEALFAQPRRLSLPPRDLERFVDLQLSLARGAAGRGNWASAYNIARQIDDLVPAGDKLSDQSYAVRDDVTGLAWLAGQAAYSALGRPMDAVAMFERYATAGQSLQVASKGHYWAGRAASRAGRSDLAVQYYDAAARTPELFYGQLALEKLGRPIPAPGTSPSIAVTDAQRRAFEDKRLVAALRSLRQYGSRSEQALFVRALADNLDNDADRMLAAQMGVAIGRPDLAVWTEREARNSGDRFYYAAAYPSHQFAASTGRTWSLAHGITRQESSFDKGIVSHAGAMGMMQLMPGTARQYAGKMGMAYDGGRLTSDPTYNVALGTYYFEHLVDVWNGSIPLAVAAYNAGSGNVSKWIRNNGDPRTGQIDMVTWIERIPFDETRGYVQRVLENTVVYDQLNPGGTGGRRLTTYLGSRG